MVYEEVSYFCYTTLELSGDEHHTLANVFPDYETFSPPISLMPYHSKSKLPGRLGVGTQVNFGIINEWLGLCKRKHTCHESSSSIEITLINCKTRQLERKVTSEAFVALSYVWGPSSADTRTELLSIGSKLSNLPLLIEDALQVCNKINIGYLWVDRYCISQDPEESHRQIANMDVVYKEAVLTIIAASCDTPSSGLPGVNNTKRSGQRALRIGDWVLIIRLPSPQAIVLESKWNSVSDLRTQILPSFLGKQHFVIIKSRHIR